MGCGAAIASEHSLYIPTLDFASGKAIIAEPVTLALRTNTYRPGEALPACTAVTRR
jgi:hypothetical protein